ncbi:tetratricopeptide repeat protein [Polynucleobacter sp. es-EL-1]|uniref:tetratricopeptide repeat protein n=1 Tax=Polynucleobacter sp. es-EL-1 TaxID=1855652 RepID=UPI001BFCDB13|nr:tetratricopeptide repeat protein [Polynucleobacter sp. es-EL-1]QWE10694.1 tetratricopeptide repeat protein [Polynucleobacter sp. es-EL-1]
MNPKVQVLIGEAVSLFQNGLVNEAEFSLLQVLKIQKNNLPALEILGLIKASTGSHSEAIHYLKKAVQINANNASTQYNLAKVLSESSAHLASLPHHEKATKLAPENLDAWINYGKSLSAVGKIREAVLAFDKALLINPNKIEVILNKAIALRGLGLYADSISAFDIILNQQPGHYLALLNKGITLVHKKSYDEGIACLDEAIAISPQDASPLIYKGLALYERKLYQDALSVSLSAFNLEPNSPDILLNIGSIFNELKQYHEAIAYFDKAIELDPNYAEAYFNKGLALSEIKDYEHSLESYNKAFAINPNIEFLIGSRLRMKMELGDWSNIVNEISALALALSENKKVIAPFALMPLIDSPSLQLQAAKIWASTSNHIEELTNKPTIIGNDDNKIRLAYFSADFKNHPVAHLTSELFELHNRDKFEVYGISLEKANPDDSIRQRLMQAFDHFIELEDKSDQEIAKYCKELGIDIAIDLGGYTKSARPDIFKYRVAPIQVNYLGFPGSLGSSSFDYIIADKVVIPESAKNFYTEKVAYLPHSYMVDDSKRLPSDSIKSRSEFDLPEDAFIYCCFNNSYKFNKPMIESWSRILHQVNNSALWLSENTAPFRKNLISEFQKLGIESSRIIFAERLESISDHLARHRLADLFLDTLPFNAHTTAIDALKSGLPLLTTLGNSFPARVAGSLLTTLGMPELIAKDAIEYEDIAVELGNNLSKLDDLKLQLSSNIKTSPLFNTKLFTSNIEALYTHMHSIYRNNQPPDHI